MICITEALIIFYEVKDLLVILLQYPILSFYFLKLFHQKNKLDGKM